MKPSSTRSIMFTFRLPTHLTLKLRERVIDNPSGYTQTDFIVTALDSFLNLSDTEQEQQIGARNHGN